MTNLSKYIQKVQQGAQITLCKSGQPVAQIIPFEQKSNIQFGIAKGLVKIHDSFFDELTDADFPGIGLPKKKKKQ